MTRFAQRPLFVALTAALAFATLAPAANAQQSMREQEQRSRRMSSNSEDGVDGKQAEQKKTEYPNAVRVSPKAETSGKVAKQIQAMQGLFEKSEMAEAMAKAEEVVAMPSANAYEKAFAYSMAGNAAADLNDQAKAVEYFKKAIDANGLDNDSHFNTMYNLSVIQFQLEKYADALTTMDRFLADTKSDKPEHQAFRAGILANLGRNDEAAAVYKSLVAKNPTDKRILMNAVAALQNAEKLDQANTLLEEAYKRGILSERNEYRMLYIGYMNAQRWNDAQKVIEDGVAKGVLQAGPDLARDYQVLAQSAYGEDKIPLAIELYGKAAPMAADGEAYLNLAKVLDIAGKKAEAKSAAQKALDKGVKKPDDAKRILSH